MSDWFYGLVLVVVGLASVIFRKKFRHNGPAGLGALIDRGPNTKFGQGVVVVMGVIITLGGIHLLIRAVSTSFRGIVGF